MKAGKRRLRTSGSRRESDPHLYEYATYQDLARGGSNRMQGTGTARDRPSFYSLKEIVCGLGPFPCVFRTPNDCPDRFELAHHRAA